MPLETFTGPDFETLFAQAGKALGPDATILSARRSADGRGFELTAADPATAAEHTRRPTPATAPPPRRPLPPVGKDRVPPLPHHGGAGPLVLAFVGPTGAGKTTTVAKLATHPDVTSGRTVGLLCLDTYRIGAVEQLRTYAGIAGLPMEVVYETAELAGALRRLADRDVVLVDTAGRGPAGRGDTTATQLALHRLRPAELHVVLPAGLQPSLAARAIEGYRARGASHFIATKLDEYPEDMGVFSLATEAGLRVRWYADGQDVPGDLRAAGPLLRIALQSRGGRPGRVAGVA